MSLYIIAKAEVPDPLRSAAIDEIVSICRKLNLGCSFDIDPMDDLVFNEAGLSKGIGFYVYSPPDDHEATSLWIESRDVALSIAPDMSKANWPEILAFSFPENFIQEMSRTRAGQLLVLLSRISHYSRIGICFLDGGVEEIWEKSFNDCLQNILPMFLLPWDVSPNILFIWDKMSV